MRKSSALLFVTSIIVTLGIAGTAAPSTIHTAAGTGISDLMIVTNTASFHTSSATYVNVTGAVGTLTVKDGGLIRARFSAESRCGAEGGPKGSICSMRILVIGGSALNPQSGLDFAFDSNDGICCTDVLPEAHAMEWVSGQLPAGTYTVRAQAATQNTVDFDLDDWTYSLEAIDP